MKKKPTSIRLQIPEPCSQNFSEMHPLPGGRYCDQCEKTVVDFRGMSDGQVAHIYEKRKGRVCGIFHDDQLNRELNTPYIPDRKNNWKAVAAMAASLFFGNIAVGQAPVSPEKTSINNTPKDVEDKQSISGKITDEKGEPLMFATVALKGTNYGTETNEFGEFRLAIPANIDSHEIEALYMGYQTGSFLWKKGHASNLIIELKEGLRLTEVVVTASNVKYIRCTTTGLSVRMQADEYGKKSEAPLEKTKEIDLSVFPNPFASHISLKINLEKADAYLFHLYSNSGQLLFAETRELAEGEQTIYFDFGKRNLSEGTYFFRISDSIGEVRTKKLIKVSQ